MRMIDADALKESIKKQVDILRLIGNDEVMQYADIIQRGFFQEIDNAPAIEPQKWIPCSVDLPKNKSDVIVTVDDGGIYTETDWYTDNRGFSAYGEDVVAWMPLPEPWKGEEQ